MNNHRIRLAVVAVIATIAGGLVLTAGPVQAALPYCNNISYVQAYSGAIRYETYVSNGSYTTRCDMNWLNVNGTAGQRKAIKQLQWDLNWCYSQGLDIDGEYGPLTRQAVRDVQDLLNRLYGAGLVVDGWAGPRTRGAMSHVHYDPWACMPPELSGGQPSLISGYESIPYEGP